MALSTQYVVLTFESVYEILWCYHSNETSSAVLSHGTIYLAFRSNFWVDNFSEPKGLDSGRTKKVIK